MVGGVRRALAAPAACVSALACLAVGAAPAAAGDFMVTTLAADESPGSLRAAWAAATDEDNPESELNRIVFAPSLSGTIDLSGLGDDVLPLHTQDPIEIVGPGADQLTIRGNSADPIFSVVEEGGLSGLTLEHGMPALFIEPRPLSPAFIVTDARFQMNPGSDGNPVIRGGAIRAHFAGVVVENSVFASNGSAFGEGGGIYGHNSSITVRGSLFYENEAEGGAAIYAGHETWGNESVSDTVVIENSTFADNLVNGNAGWSWYVGGVVGYSPAGGSLEIRNSTIVGTKFAPTVPGMGAVRVPEGTARIYNTVLADNDPLLDDLSGQFAEVAYSLLEDRGSPTIGNAHHLIEGIDPMLGPLAANGGATDTMLPEPGSPLIDAGKRFGDALTDQRGLQRTVDFLALPNADGGDGTDIGAAEVQDPAPPRIEITSPTDGAVFLEGDVVTAAYECDDGEDGTGIESCAGPVESGADIDTSRPGKHKFVVSAADFGGNTAKRTVTYTVKKFPRCNGKRATIFAKRGKPTKGTPGPDVIVGTAGNDRIDGRGGNDVICGGRGKDKLKGGSGKDKLFGGPGKDALIGGPGKDKLVGGPGRDTERQ